MNRERELGGLDYFKILGALLVIAIHTSPLAALSPGSDVILTGIIARIAVPFFLMVTGFFTLEPILFNKNADTKPFLRFIKKTLFLYTVAIIIYLPVNFYAGHFQNIGLYGFLKMLIFDGTLYHLWYLPASVMGAALIYGGSRRFSPKTLLFSGIFLYILGLFGDSYFGFIKNIPPIATLYKGLFQVFSYTRNGIFYAPIFLLMGAFIGHFRKKTSAKEYVAGFLIAFVMMIAEGITLKNLGVQRHDSMYFALPICMFFLFKIIVSLRVKPRKSLRTVATSLYLLHPLAIVILRGGAKILHMEELLVANSLIHYLGVCLITLCWAVIIERIMGLKGRGKFLMGRAWIELDRENLKGNVEALRQLLPPGCRLMPVLKANAYGHGGVLVGRELNALKIYNFCVATALEGVELRRGGVKGEILVLGYTHPQDFFYLSRYRLTQTVIDANYGQLLNGYGKKLPVHVKIDTGMGRLGERSDRIENLCSIFCCKNLVVRGAYTHLCADSNREPVNKAFTEAQAKAFFQAIEALKERGCPCPRVHLTASYGLLNYPEIPGDYARIGIALYGLLSSKPEEGMPLPNLRPVLSLKARVALVRELFEGETAGYDLAYTAEKDMRIAAIAVGYADGIPRGLAEAGGHVLINGSEAPIIGRICMDQMLVDVSAVENPQAGDVAVIIGVSGAKELTAYHMGELTGTITNEILSRLGSRPKRFFV